MDFLLRHLKETSKHVQKPNELMNSDAVIHFEVGTAHFVVDLTGLTPDVISCHGNQCPSDGDVWVSVTPADLRALLERRLSLMTAMMQKRLRLTGNTSVLHSMGWLWESWRIHAPVANRGGPHKWVMGALRWAGRASRGVALSVVPKTHRGASILSNRARKSAACFAAASSHLLAFRRSRSR